MEYFKHSKLKEGYTTGTCAAAAAKASASYITTGSYPDIVTIITPNGRRINLDIINCCDGYFGVIKDAGDDCDATDKMMIKAKVEILPHDGEFTFKAGPGVGTVTLSGLKVSVGEPAINPVPRQMIETAVREVTGTKSVCVTVSIPGGEKKACHTFNPRLGVVGGLSILGTTGIVKPLSEEAIYKSLALEVSTFASERQDIIGLTFGNTGEKAMRSAFNIKDRRIMQCGNYIGFVLDEVASFKIKKVFISGHPGKLLKVAAGTFNTHNRTGDGRMESLCTQVAIAGGTQQLVREIYNCRTTDQAITILHENSYDHIWNTLADIVARRCTMRYFDEIEVATAFVTSDGKILGTTQNTDEFIRELNNE